MSHKLKNFLLALLALLFWVLVWHGLSLYVGQDLLLPSPAATVKALIKAISESKFFLNVGTSLFRILSGFVLGVIIGCLLSALTYSVPAADILLTPIIRLVRTAPVASFIILALLWIGHSRVPGFISMLMVAPVVCQSVRSALDETSPQLLEMAKCCRLTTAKTILYIYIPSALPAFISSCISSIGLAWKSGVAAEVLCLPKEALGTQLYYSKLYIETPSLFAWTAVVIILSYLIEKVFIFLMRKLRSARFPERRSEP